MVGSLWPRPRPNLCSESWEPLQGRPLNPVLSLEPLPPGIRGQGWPCLQGAGPYAFLSCCWFQFVSMMNQEGEVWTPPNHVSLAVRGCLQVIFHPQLQVTLPVHRLRITSSLGLLLAGTETESHFCLVMFNPCLCSWIGID